MCPRLRERVGRGVRPLAGEDRGQDPARRCFQAFRIFINRELDELTAVLPQIIPRLTEGGRIAVISFHSLEDRIVKNFLRDAATTDTFPSWVPVRAADLPAAPIALEGKAQRASAAEVKANPRARSAIMRVATRTAGEWVAQPRCGRLTWCCWSA